MRETIHLITEKILSFIPSILGAIIVLFIG
ncbi:mechanosensitive ion channel family protein [Galbibacter orientalis]